MPRSSPSSPRLTRGSLCEQGMVCNMPHRKPITQQDITTLRSIGRKSINEFSSEDIQKTKKWAYKFYQELGVKSPFFRAWFGDWRANDTKTKVKFIPLNTEYTTAKEISRRSAYNSDTEWTINVNRDGIDETANKNGKWSAAYHSLVNIREMLETRSFWILYQLTDRARGSGIMYCFFTACIAR